MENYQYYGMSQMTVVISWPSHSSHLLIYVPPLEMLATLCLGINLLPLGSNTGQQISAIKLQGTPLGDASDELTEKQAFKMPFISFFPVPGRYEQTQASNSRVGRNVLLCSCLLVSHMF